jgi:DNA polymerase IV (DinB-like DNA polymerase)
MDRIILHVDLDSFYASLEELRNKDVMGKPLVVCVYSGRSEDSGVVSTANYKARKLGIKSGMPIAFAKRIAKEKNVVFLPVDMEYYRTVSDRIMELLEGEAEVMEQVSVDEAYLDVTEKTRGRWVKAEEIAGNIKKKISDREGVTCSVGAGPNKLIAKMASKHRKPDGLTVVKEKDVKSFLENMPILGLHGIGPKTAKVLEELGVETAGELASFDLPMLAEKFGENTARLLRGRASGIDDSPVEPRERQQISRIGTLKEDTGDIEEIFNKIKELAEDLKGKIGKERVYFRTVSIIAVDTNLKTHLKSETIAETDDIEAALKVARKLLEGFPDENPETLLRRVGIRVSNLVYKKEQTTLKDF